MGAGDFVDGLVGEFDIFSKVDGVFDLQEDHGSSNDKRSSEQTPGRGEVSLV